MDIKKIKLKDIQYALDKGKVLRYIPSLIDKARGKEERTYSIEGTLGQGGFGITYLASSTFKIGNVPQKVYFAIKEFFVKGQCWRETGGAQMMLPKAEEAQKDVAACLDEFVGEAERLNKICKNNLHIVNVNEVFHANNTAYYVMEFLDGGSLKDRLEKGGLPEPEALSILLPIAKAVDELHRSHRIVHCDIKPDNIMMRRNDDGTLFPVLIDFGGSRHFNADGSLTSRRNAVEQSDGYAPLEQKLGDLSKQVDVYALGATLLHALTGGKRPLNASDIEDAETYVRSRLPNTISQNLRDAIIHAMQKNKKNRTATVADFVQELENGIVPPAKPDELQEGYVLNAYGAYYVIASPGQKKEYFITYKAVRCSKKEDALSYSSGTKTKRAQVDIYEFFVDGHHHRNDDMSISADGETSAAWQQYLKLCSEKTGNKITHEFLASKGEGWATFEANNTYYTVWSKIRKPLPWRKIVTYSTIGIVSLLLAWGGVSVVQGIYAAKERKRQEMSLRLTEAIASNDEAVLREFAVEHDSIRAYIPYANICLSNGDFETALVVVQKAQSPEIVYMYKQEIDSLTQVIAQKQDSNSHNVEDEPIKQIVTYPEDDSQKRASFEGVIKNGNRIEGKLVWKNGDSFEGSFDNDNLSEGTITLNNGLYFKGSFNNNQPYDGTWYKRNGTIYMNMKKGKGI